MFKAIYHLLFGQSFEFHSSHNVDETLQRLHQRNYDDLFLLRSRIYRSRLWQMQLQQDQDRVHFWCKPSVGFRQPIYQVVEGEFQSDDTGTCVKGMIRFRKLSFIQILGIPLLLGILWIHTVSQDVSPLPLIILSGVFLVVVVIIPAWFVQVAFNRTMQSMFIEA